MTCLCNYIESIAKYFVEKYFHLEFPFIACLNSVNRCGWCVVRPALEINAPHSVRVVCLCFPCDAANSDYLHIKR